jgi:hypothetical protein
MKSSVNFILLALGTEPPDTHGQQIYNLFTVHVVWDFEGHMWHNSADTRMQARIRKFRNNQKNMILSVQNQRNL